MFNRNLDALKLKNPKLAEKLLSISIENAKENIEVYQAESKDLIMSYQGLALDDIYNPIRVTKTNWNMNVPNKLAKYDIVVVFGLGLGYLFKRAYVSCDSRILLYEPQIDILRFVLEYVDFSAEINDSRVYVTVDKQEALNFINDKYLSDDKLVFLYPQPYAQLKTNLLAEFTNDIVNVCNLKKLDINTISSLSKKWAEYTILNILNMKKTRPITLLKNKFDGKTALIAAAGPSLADNIKKIKKYRDKLTIFAINRTAALLYKNDIEPDFVVFVDAVNIIPTIKGIEDKLENNNIIAEIRTNNIVFEKFNNIYTYFPDADAISEKLSEITDNKISLLKTAGTSSAQAYYAAKCLGFKNIIFAGLDLAFKDDLLYASGQKANLDLENNCINIVASKSIKKSLLKVKSINGDDILTRDDYALFIRQFSDIFKTEENINIYNLSSFGAYIDGMKYVSLDDVISEVQTDLEDFDFADFINSTNHDWNKTYEEVLNFIDSLKPHWIEINLKAKTLYDANFDLMVELKNNSENKQIIEKLIGISNEFSAFLKIVMADVVLSEYFQGDFASFVNVCNKKSENINSFIEFKNFEMKILNELSDVITRFLLILDKGNI